MPADLSGVDPGTYCSECGEVWPEGEDACAACGSTARTYVVAPASIDLNEPKRPDGFQPIALGVLMWGGITGFPRDRRYWHMVTTARRIDAAHRQLERAREHIEAYRQDEEKGAGDPTDAVRVLNDVELALVALNRAITMTYSISGTWEIKVPIPAIVTAKRESVKELRDVSEHVDERELKDFDPQNPRSLFAVIGWGAPLIEKGELSYGDWSVGLYQEATDLLIALRGYVRDAWIEMTNRENEGSA